MPSAHASLSSSSGKWDCAVVVPEGAAQSGNYTYVTPTIEVKVPNDCFRDTYVRTNKVSGQKHLRCFPQCSLAGHCTKTACGEPLIVETISPAHIPPSDIFVYAQIIDHANRATPIRKSGATHEHEALNIQVHG